MAELGQAAFGDQGRRIGFQREDLQPFGAPALFLLGPGYCLLAGSAVVVDETAGVESAVVVTGRWPGATAGSTMERLCLRDPPVWKGRSRHPA